MTTFIGEYIAKADDKGRLVFPSAFKAVMPVDGDMRFVLKKDIFEDCLEMYTFGEWNGRAVRSNPVLIFSTGNTQLSGGNT